MQIEFEGQTYTLDLDEIDVSEARHIKRQTGLSLLAFQEGLAQVDVDCVVAAYWLMRKQSGTVVDMNAVNFPVVRFTEALIKAAEKEAEANPTEPETASTTTE